jgi:hypothetical protein
MGTDARFIGSLGGKTRLPEIAAGALPQRSYTPTKHS